MRKVTIKKIMIALPKAHKDISKGESLSFENSLCSFSNLTLENIVLKRLNELIKNPKIKR